MKNLTRNPLFYVSLTLAVLLGFQTYGLVSAAYTPPGGNPPTGGNPAQPLDTSPFRQFKSGNLVIGTSAPPNVEINGAGVAKIVFKESGSYAGGIYLTNGKLYAQATNQNKGNPFEIGSGTGAISKIIAGTNITLDPATGVGEVKISSTELWKKEATNNNIYYDQGAVKIAGDLIVEGTGVTGVGLYFPRYSSGRLGLELIHEGIPLQTYNFTWLGGVQTPSLSCDTNKQSLKDCFYRTQTAGSGAVSTAYNVSFGPPFPQLPFLSGDYSQVYDKVDNVEYVYVNLDSFAQNFLTSSEKVALRQQYNIPSTNAVIDPANPRGNVFPRLWCDITPLSLQAEQTMTPVVSGSSSGSWGDCTTVDSSFYNEYVLAPGSGQAGGWPNVVYNWAWNFNRLEAEPYVRVFRSSSRAGGGGHFESINLRSSVSPTIDGIVNKGPMNWFSPGDTADCKTDGDRGKIRFSKNDKPGTNYTNDPGVGDRMCYCKKGVPFDGTGYSGKYFWSCW